MGRGVPKHDDEIIAMRERGLSISETAKAAGVEPWVVNYCTKRHGLSGKYRSNRKPQPRVVADKPVKQKRGKYRRPFTLLEEGDHAFIKVLPTSRPQYDRLLAMLKREGGEVV